MLSSKEDKSVYYFAYGANMSPDLFKSRVPDYEFLGLAELHKHELKFNVPCEYLNKGFAGIAPCADGIVFGALYKISKTSLVFLDWAEWVPFNFYRRELIEVVANSKKNLANVYIQQCPKEGLIPSNGYKNLILKSLENINADANYIKKIKEISGQNQFELDHSFNLSNPSKRRVLRPSFYRWHDIIREWMCEYI